MPEAHSCPVMSAASSGKNLVQSARRVLWLPCPLSHPPPGLLQHLQARQLWAFLEQVDFLYPQACVLTCVGNLQEIWFMQIS